MNLPQTIWRWLRSLGQHRVVKQEIDEEFAFHIEQRTTENIAAGMSPVEAAREARKRFGNVQSVREECRDAQGSTFGDSVLQDIHFGLRMLRKSPGFTVIVMLTLAVGIGANAAIFSFVNAILIRPLPYADPDQLVRICHAYPELNLYGAPVSPFAYFHYRDQATSFANIGAAEAWSPVLTSLDHPELLSGMKVTASLFPTLGVNAIKGRVFLAEEDKPGANRVAVISHAFWQRKLLGDPNAVGRKLALDGQSYTIVGILPSGFKLIGETDVWTTPAITDPSSQMESLFAVGRLKPGVTLVCAHAEMNTIADTLREVLFRGCRTAAIEVESLRDTTVGNIRPSLMILSAVVIMVLLIACMNVANLLLARATGRQKEIAVRSALGAGRLRLVRQMLTESLLLSLLGGGCGLLLAYFSIGAMRAAVPAGIAQYIQGWQHIGIDGRVVGFTLAASLLTGIIFGLAPAWRGTWVNLNDTLKESSRGASEGGRRHRLRSLFVVSELALAIVLLIGAGLLVKSFAHVQKVAPGFEPDHVLTFKLSLPEKDYAQPARTAAFCAQLVDKLSAMPGVTSAGLGRFVPFGNGWTGSFGIEGLDTGPNRPSPHGAPNGADAGYFRTLAIPLIQGRFFTEHDNASSVPVAIVDDKLARQYWPNESALGKRISFSFEEKEGQPAWREIVGVVGHVKIYGLDAEAKEQYYFPELQIPTRDISLVIRTPMDAKSLASAVQSQVWSLDKNLPLSGLQTMDDLLNQSLAPKRQPMFLISLFAALSLALAAMGLYGVISFAVDQRNHELGIRMALGAQPGDVLRLVLGDAMRLVLLGTAIGVAGSLALTKLLSNSLFGVSPLDPMTFAEAAALLAIVALAASYFPARRAANTDPMTALRDE
jgi:putative ABC transport system permease protein